jgi:hypothetical protein
MKSKIVRIILAGAAVALALLFVHLCSRAYFDRLNANDKWNPEFKFLRLKGTLTKDGFMEPPLFATFSFVNQSDKPIALYGVRQPDGSWVVNGWHIKFDFRSRYSFWGQWQRTPGPAPGTWVGGGDVKFLVNPGESAVLLVSLFIIQSEAPDLSRYDIRAYLSLEPFDPNISSAPFTLPSKVLGRCPCP